ncbi:hypothetical protein BDN72DRAFT_854439 [Pluteus cervinus]|uniref:Uncharacterized protein n=1 Tax=Pluteus cervinus TaxID=181527 RepID=A0ACD3B855_9AGAR|nr:hypothetical protein BDN72DRAFT_854439 [Pluteus cervinus]
MSPSTPPPDPLFPPEIEHIIFVTAFQHNLQRPLNLLLTSKRNLHWLAPLLYNTVTINLPTSTSHIHLFREHGHLIHHLLFEFPPNLFDTNVMEMDIWIFAYFKGLTHLAVEGIQAEQRVISVVLSRKSLKVFVLWFAFPSCGAGQGVEGQGVLEGEEKEETTTSRVYHQAIGLLRHINDSRVVAIQRHRKKDWEVGTRGGKDMWAIANAEVEGRRTAGQRVLWLYCLVALLSIPLSIASPKRKWYSGMKRCEEYRETVDGGVNEMDRGTRLVGIRTSEFGPDIDRDHDTLNRAPQKGGQQPAGDQNGRRRRGMESSRVEWRVVRRGRLAQHKHKDKDKDRSEVDVHWIGLDWSGGVIRSLEYLYLNDDGRRRIEWNRERKGWVWTRRGKGKDVLDSERKRRDADSTVRVDGSKVFSQ